MNRLRVAVVGCGHLGSIHARLLQVARTTWNWWESSTRCWPLASASPPNAAPRLSRSRRAARPPGRGRHRHPDRTPSRSGRTTAQRRRARADRKADHQYRRRGQSPDRSGPPPRRRAAGRTCRTIQSRLERRGPSPGSPAVHRSRPRGNVYVPVHRCEHRARPDDPRPGPRPVAGRQPRRRRRCHGPGHVRSPRRPGPRPPDIRQRVRASLQGVPRQLRTATRHAAYSASRPSPLSTSPRARPACSAPRPPCCAEKST